MSTKREDVLKYLEEANMIEISELVKDIEEKFGVTAAVPVAAAAVGIVAIDGIWQDLKDKNGFTKDCEVGRSLGYVGKSVIHPDQIQTVHKIFHPNKAEIEWAKKVCSVYEELTKKGKGATVVEGKMIDEVHYKRAKALLEI